MNEKDNSVMDREKIMNGLQAIAENKACQNCCYPYMGHGVICGQEIARDAISLLKEQEKEISFLKAMQLQTVKGMDERELGEIVGKTLGLWR